MGICVEIFYCTYHHKGFLFVRTAAFLFQCFNVQCILGVDDVISGGDLLVGFNLLQLSVRNKAQLVVDAPLAKNLCKRATVAHLEDFVGETVLNHNDQGFFLFASENSFILKDGAALLPGPTISWLVWNNKDRFPRQDIEGIAVIEQTGWIVDVASVVSAAFDQGRIRFKNHILGTRHFFFFGV